MDGDVEKHEALPRQPIPLRWTIGVKSKFSIPLKNP